MLRDLTEDKVAELLGLVAEVKHASVPTHDSELSLTHMDHELSAEHGVVARGHDAHLDRGAGGRAQGAQVARDERVLELPGHGIQDEHGPQSEHHMLGLLNDLFQQCGLGGHLEQGLAIRGPRSSQSAALGDAQGGRAEGGRVRVDIATVPEAKELVEGVLEHVGVDQLGLHGPGRPLLLGPGRVAERDDELDVGEEAGRDLMAHHHVRNGRLELNGLLGQLGEELLAEEHVLSRLQLLLPMHLGRWEKPLDDGGRPITHYIIQKKDKFGGWFDALVTDDKACTATIDDLEAKVPGLSEGKWYQFRVVAANKAGDSPPSSETKPHLCRHKNLRPCIDKGAAGSKSVRVHRSAIWHIKVKGEPPPQFSWYKNGNKLINSDEFVIATDEYQGGATAMLQVFRSQMHDAGTYTLVAENRNGSDKIDLDLVVLAQMDDGDCNMFKHGMRGCTCSAGFRHNELSAQQILTVDFGDPPPSL
eukprot:maker-scaffold175_size286436-snap-gene-1.53 protein:Tk09301 transcript:maker-scaffold175_size286436-snap-gene-1.53-mRNA-1 annotation:"low quality protein: twitchin-like"